MIPKSVKKISPSLFAILLVTALFFSGVLPKENIPIAEASFLDTIVALVTINPLRVSISAPREVDLEQKFKAEVIIKNRGRAKISNIEVEIFISEGLVLVSKNATKKIGQISGNKEKNILWQVKGIETGNFSISVQASGIVRGDAVSAEGNTAIVTVKEKSPPPGKPTNIFQDFFNFFQRWF